MVVKPLLVVLLIYLEPEVDKLSDELQALAKEKKISLADEKLLMMY